MQRCSFSRSLLPALGLLLVGSTVSWADDWPQWLGPKRDGVWREAGIIESFPKDGPKKLWSTPVASGYAGPAVAGGKVIVTDWQLARGQKLPDNPFTKPPLTGQERVLCLDAATGKELWKHSYDCRYEIQYAAGPRATPLIAGGKVYTLGAMGDLLCLELDSGKVLWSKNFVKDYGARVPIWGFAAHPLLDGDRLVCLVGGAGSAAVAFDKDTGKEVWKALTTSDIGYCPPTLIEAGGKRQLVIWHPESVNGLDPETGKPYWSQKFNVKANLTIPTPRQQGDRLFVTSFYNGSLMLQLDKDKPGASVLWKGKGRNEQPEQTADLHAIMATPIFKGEHIYGVCSYGELRCVKAADGERVWMTLKATGNESEPVERWANAFLVENGERTFLFNEKGDLIIAKLSPEGYKEISRTHLLKPTGRAGRPVLWSHPAFANKCIIVRNDEEIACFSLARE